MNNKHYNIRYLLQFIFILSIAIFIFCGCSNSSDESETTSSTSSETSVEFNLNLLAQINCLADNQYITSYEVLEEEQKILLGINEVKPLDECETNEDSDIQYEYEYETNENSDVLIGDNKILLYEYDIKSDTMKEIDTASSIITSLAWHGRTIVYIDSTNSLFQATIENGKLSNISKLSSEENLTISTIYDVTDKLIIFAAMSKGTCLASLENGKITNIKTLDISGAFDAFDGFISINSAVFVGDTPKIFAEIIVFSETDMNGDTFTSDDMSIKYCFLEPDYTDANIEDLLDTSVFISMSTNIETDKIYQLSDFKSIYVGSLSAFITKAKEAPGTSTDTQEPYTPGSYSCDSYDKGNFSSDYRNKTDENIKSGVYYEIFVRSFADSNGDGIGDFNGITEKLDYLKDLGIEGIWLMPINSSPSYHGYDVTDYLTLNSEYGTEDDFKKLLDEAHKRGIKVIIDFVINHTSNEHPWFKSAISDINSEYRDYYRFVHKNDSTDYSKDDRSNWDSKVWHKSGDFNYYGIFGSHMPDLNYNNPAVREAIKSAAGKWLELGVDGFRLDAAMHIYGANEFKQESDPTSCTLTWWNEFALYCESINPNVYLVGEAWNENDVLEEYVQPFDTKFNFTLQEYLMNCLINHTAMANDKESLSSLLENIIKTYDTVDSNFLDGIFGSNHDQERIMSSLNDTTLAKQIASVYMTLSGNPYIYYGEELGMLGKKPDEMIRTPFLWGDTSKYNTSWIKDSQNTNTETLEEQMKNPNSVYSFYKQLISIRKSNPALVNGSYKSIDLGNPSVMAYIRETDGQKLLVIHNFSNETQELNIENYSLNSIIFNSDNSTTLDLSNTIKVKENQSIIIQIN